MLTVSRFENKFKLKPQIAEDLWHLEKIIKPGDLVSASTHRKFVADSGKSERKRVFITISAEKIEFHKGFEKLRILGEIKSGKPEDLVQIGEHHSLDIGLNDNVSIEKEKWMKYDLDRIKEAEVSADKPKISALIMDEREAELFVIKEYGIDSIGKINLKGAGKYSDSGDKEKDFKKIFDLVSRAVTDKIVLAGSGFEKENFFNFVKDKDAKFAKKFFLQDIGNVGKQGIYELVNKDVFSKITKESRFAEETKLMEELVKAIASKKATYALKNVEEALDFGAVDKLLILDSYLFENREEIDKLISKAEKIGAKVKIISHENEVSEKLKAFTGIAALLRFKVE